MVISRLGDAVTTIRGVMAAMLIVRMVSPSSADGAGVLPPSALTILTKQGLRYDLDEFRFDDGRLIAAGSVESDGQVRPFQGELNPADVAYVSGRNDSGSNLAWMLTAGFAAAGLLAIAESRHNNLHVTVTTERHVPPGGSDGGGSSCPLVYAWDGRRYVLEAETFEDAFCRGRERTDLDALPHLTAEAGRWRIRVSNERPETHYLRLVRLVVADAPAGARVVVDHTGVLRTIRTSLAPSAATDMTGRELLPEITRMAGEGWVSRVTSESLGRTDGLTVEFPRPRGARRVTLIACASNTDLGVRTMHALARLHGHRLMEWYRRLDTDAGERDRLQAFMEREGYLHVLVWNGARWIAAGAIPNVGPELFKEIVVPIDLGPAAAALVRIRLESTAGLWRVRNLRLAASLDEPIRVTELSVDTAVDEGGRDVRSLLTGDAALPYVTRPGQWAELSVREIPRPAGTTRTILIKTRGYYYRWIKEGDRERPALYAAALRFPGLAARLAASAPDAIIRRSPSGAP